MPFFAALLQLALVAIPAFAAPSTLQIVDKYIGQVRPGSYIVTLKDGTVSTNAIGSISNGSTITHQYTVINGFSGTFTNNDLNILRSHSDVASIAEDGIMTTYNTQLDATWGLGRVSSSTKLADQTDSHLTFSYRYDATGGSGVNVYVVDTGIYTAHPDFGGRASWGATFGGYPSADGNGHGTHVAGTVASIHYGVAKSANVIAVKVLSDQGSGYVSDIVAGLNWVAGQASSTGKPTIATMSLGGGASAPLDSAVASLTNAGIHVTVAAGNSATDAGNTSPARAPSAITVGATDITDTMAYFSNYGSVLDTFAPGLNVISTWNDGTTRSLSGTSMATPHVAGLAAYLISIRGNMSPAALSSTITSLALSGVLSGIPAGTINGLINNGYTGV